MTLSDQIRIKINEFHQAKLKIIDAFDYSNIKWKVKQDMYGLVDDDYLEQGIDNLKKYYAVALLDPLNQHAVSEKVDPFWHAHILFTEEYINFCYSVFNQYIHHVPLDHENATEITRVEGLYNYTLAKYKEMFYENNEEWWPEPTSVSFKAICFHNTVSTPEVVNNALYEVV